MVLQARLCAAADTYAHWGARVSIYTRAFDGGNQALLPRLGRSTLGHLRSARRHNPGHDWISPIYMGLNQAPIAVLIENDRTGLAWKNFMANPEIEIMLRRLDAVTGQ